MASLSIAIKCITCLVDCDVSNKGSVLWMSVVMVSVLASC